MRDEAQHHARPAGWLIAGLLALSMTLNGCDPGALIDKATNSANNAIQDASDEIDVAISQLQNTSASWQQVLQNLEGKLVGDAKDLIGNDIQNLITRSVNHAGVEFRCDADFINQRIVEALIAIKAKLLGQTPPPLQPRFCSAIPELVDMKLVPSDVRAVTFYGFNFDTPENRDNFQLKLESIGGAVQDVTRAISIPTAYAMTLALGPSGVPVNNNSARLLLYWRDKLVSTVSVIPVQPVVKVCQSSVDNKPMQPIGPLLPPRTRGDSDFSGHGPTIFTSASLTNTPTDVTLRLYFHAKETKSDWTTVGGSMSTVIYRAPAGHAIDKVASATSAKVGPQDVSGTSSPKVFQLGGGGLLNRLEVIGDTDGDDVGRTGIKRVMLNPLQVIIHEVGDCVPPLPLSQLLGTRFLSTQVSQSVRSRVMADRARLDAVVRRPIQR